MNFALLALGLGLILLGGLLIALALASGGARVRGGGLIMIGPIPIIFGSRSLGAALLLVAITIMVIILAIAFMMG